MARVQAGALMRDQAFSFISTFDLHRLLLPGYSTSLDTNIML